MGTRNRANRRAATAACLLAAGVMAIAGCGGDDGDEGDGGQAGQPQAEETVKVGLALVGPRNDQAASQGVYEGIGEAEKESGGKIEFTSTVENVVDPQAQVDVLRNLAQTNDLVVGGASSFVSAAETVAPSFPDVHFIVTNSTLKEGHPNITTLVPQPGLPSFVAGVVMAHLSKTGAVGWVGGGESPTTLQSRAGVTAGIEHQDPDVKLLDTITGDYNDPAKAKAAARAQIAADADQVFGYLDSGIQGVYEAAAAGDKAGAYQIVTLRCDPYENVVGAAVLNSKAFTKEGVESFAAGTLEAGSVLYTLESDEMLRFELCPKYKEQAATRKLVEETTSKIISGEIEVPEEALFPRPSYEHTVK